MGRNSKSEEARTGVDRWNATVNRYQEMLNRKTGSTKHNPSDGDGGSTGGNTGGDGRDDLA